MRQILSLHGRANVILRADLHNAVHGMLVQGGAIDTKLFGKVRVSSPISYKTPAPRDSLAFGQIGCMGLPEREGPNSKNPGCEAGDIVGIDLYQTGHQIDAAPYYENADAFVTVPWRELMCKFIPGDDLPTPLGGWLLLEQDEIMTRRLVFSSAGVTLHMPNSAKQGVTTNANSKTKVKLAAGKIICRAPGSLRYMEPHVHLGDWALFNPMDAVSIRYTKGRTLTFVKWDDLEQAVAGDGR